MYHWNACNCIILRLEGHIVAFLGDFVSYSFHCSVVNYFYGRMFFIFGVAVPSLIQSSVIWVVKRVATSSQFNLAFIRLCIW